MSVYIWQTCIGQERVGTTNLATNNYSIGINIMFSRS